MRKVLMVFLAVLIMAAGAGMAQSEGPNYWQSADMKHRQKLINDAWLIIQRMNAKIEQWIRPDPTYYEEIWLAPNLVYIIAGNPIKAVEEFGRRHGINIPPSRARFNNPFVGKIPPSKVWSVDPRVLISGYSQYHDLTVGIIRGDSYVISPGAWFKDGGIPILGRRALGHLKIVR